MTIISTDVRNESFDPEIETRFSGGIGTIGDPFQITNLTELKWVGNTSNLNNHFVLMNDLDASTTKNWNNGAGFDPIGDNSNKFTGSFEGNGYTISNLFINRSASDYIGFFASVGTAGEIGNLTLKDILVRGDDHVGGFAGDNDGTFRKCFCTGYVGGDTYTGGFVGWNDNNAEITVSGSNCSVSGVGSSADSIGGFSGMNEGELVDCYASGWVIGYSTIGGFSGICQTPGTIDQCYSSGKVTAVANSGGFLGSSTGGTITNSYWDTETSGYASSAGGTGRTTMQMMTQSTFSGWDFTLVGDGTINEWIMAGYPHLQLENTAQISNAAELQLMSVNTSRDYSILNDITATSTSDWNGGDGFLPVGPSTNHFNGNFDGNGFTITGLYIDRTPSDYIGLFGYVDYNSIVKDIGLIDLYVSGDSAVGGLIGYSRGNISNCFVQGEIHSGGAEDAGGLIGKQSGGWINNCSASGEVYGDNYDTGGLVGELYNSYLNSSWTDIYVRGDDRTGGITGWSHGVAGINDCYSSSTVCVDGNDEDAVGGIAGVNSAPMNNCSFSGLASGDYDVGGLAGDNNNIISNSSSSGECIGYRQIGGIAGRNDGEIINCDSSTKVNGEARIGGVTGINYDLISGCSAELNIHSSYLEAGLIAGWNSDLGKIYDSHSAGSVRAGTDSGGFIGRNYGLVIGCSHSGNVSGKTITGLVGRWEMDEASWLGTRDEVKESSGLSIHGTSKNGATTRVDPFFGTVGTFDGVDDYVLVGGNTNLRIAGDMSVSFWINATDLSNQPTILSFGSQGETSTTNYLYQLGVETDGKVRMFHETGSGLNREVTTTASYVVTDEWHHVAAVRSVTGDSWSFYFDGSFKQTMSFSGDPYLGLQGALYIGSNLALRNFFNGSLDDVRIYNRMITGPEILELTKNNTLSRTTTLYSDIGGFSGRNDQGTIINSTFSGNVMGDDNIGGFVGRQYSTGSISNCSSQAFVNSSGFDIGGFIGRNQGLVDSSTSSGYVYGYHRVGGFSGSNMDLISDCSAYVETNGSNGAIGGFLGDNYGDVINCSSYGNVYGKDDVGGFVGYNFGNFYSCLSMGDAIATGNHVGGFIGTNDYVVAPPIYDGDVYDCYSTGNATGNIDVGGFVGYNMDYGEIENCYGVGKVTGNINVGGFCGLNIETITSCFFDNQSTGMSTSDGGTGRNTTQMKEYSTFANAGWSFPVWAIRDGESYPFFERGFINTPPETIDDHYQTTEDTLLMVPISGVLANDKDLDENVVPIYLAGGIYVSDFDSVSSLGCIVDLKATGDLTYDPTSVQSIQALGVNEFLIDSFTYTISDGKETDTGMVWINVTGTNDAPTAYDDHVVMMEDTVNFQIEALANDTDIDSSDVLRIHLSTQGSYGTVSISQDDLVLTYTPNANFTGMDNFTYVISDGNGGFDSASIYVTVTSENDAPVILSKDDHDAVEDILYTVQYNAVDGDEDTLEWNLDTNAKWLQFTAPTGVLFGTPGDLDVGSFWVNISVNDGNGGIDHSNFTLTVLNVNDPPIITTIPITNATEDIEYLCAFEAENVDIGDVLTWSFTTSPEWLSIDGTTGVVSGTPLNEHVGMNYVGVKVIDSAGSLDIIHFVINVQNVNDAPVWTQTPQNHEMTEGETYVQEFRATDIDGDVLSYNVSSSPASGISISPGWEILTWTDTMPGEYNVSLTANDGIETIKYNFVLSVKPLSEGPNENQTDPVDETTDTDGDGMPDWWEEFYGLDPENATDASGDMDGDNVTNLQEFKDKTSPNHDDTIPVVDDDDTDDDTDDDVDDDTDDDTDDDVDDDTQGDDDDDEKSSSFIPWLLVAVFAVIALVFIVLFFLKKPKDVVDEPDDDVSEDEDDDPDEDDLTDDEDPEDLDEPDENEPDLEEDLDEDLPAPEDEEEDD